MSVNIMQFKSRIRNLAKEEGIPAQVMLQNFMFERFFARLCKSTVRENLKAAFLATIHHRGSEDVYRDGAIILTEISRSEILKNRWGKYRQLFSFADHISFEQICNQLITLFGGITAC